MPKEVLVPLPIPCEIEQVPPAKLPEVNPNMNVFEAARTRMAELLLLRAENERLRAANTSPCPAK